MKTKKSSIQTEEETSNLSKLTKLPIHLKCFRWIIRQFSEILGLYPRKKPPDTDTNITVNNYYHSTVHNTHASGQHSEANYSCAGISSSTNTSHIKSEVEKILLDLRDVIDGSVQNQERVKTLAIVDAIKQACLQEKPDRHLIKTLVHSLPDIERIAAVGTQLLGWLDAI